MYFLLLLISISTTIYAITINYWLWILNTIATFILLYPLCLALYSGFYKGFHAD